MAIDDASELLWRMYSENMGHVRHVEVQRSTITSVMITLSGALLALMASQWRDGRTPHWGLSLILILVGILGGVLTAKLYELYVEHKERARTFRKALAGRIPDARIEELKQEADFRWKAEFPWLRPLPLHALWLGPHFVTTSLGFLTLIATTLP